MPELELDSSFCLAASAGDLFSFLGLLSPLSILLCAVRSFGALGGARRLHRFLPISRLNETVATAGGQRGCSSCGRWYVPNRESGVSWCPSVRTSGVTRTVVRSSVSTWLSVGTRNTLHSTPLPLQGLFGLFPPQEDWKYNWRGLWGILTCWI